MTRSESERGGGTEMTLGEVDYALQGKEKDKTKYSSQ
jgi:hypothetical protein